MGTKAILLLLVLCVPFAAFAIFAPLRFNRFLCLVRAGGGGREAGEQFVQGGGAAIAFEEHLIALLRGVREEARAGLRAEPALRDEVVEDGRHREPLAVGALQRRGG